jgi:hypothetical protein
MQDRCGFASEASRYTLLLQCTRLAGFTESAVAIPAQQRFLWERIEKRFKRPGNRISPKDRKRIEAVLIAKIGKPPTKAQRAALDRKRERLLTGMR